MRIGIACPYSMDVAGGVQAHVLGLADHLRDAGHVVSVLAPADGPTPPWLVSAGHAVPVRYNGSVARLTFGPVTRARTARWLADGTDGDGFDIVHLHEPMTPSCSALALWQAQVPVVATFHTSITRSRAMTAAWPAFRPALERVGARIAVSGEALSTIERHLGKRAVVIPNGVATGGFAVPPDPRWTGSPGRPTMAFLGRATEPRKGLSVLLDALPAVVAAHPGVRLVVAGRGGDEVDIPPALRPHVEILGAVSEADRAALLASVDLYVAPNTGGESFGIILVEAMAAGAPVLASDLPAFEAVLGGSHGAGRTFRTGSPASLAEAAVALLADPATRAGLADAGRLRARRYDWATVGREIEAVYETVLLAAHGDVTSTLARDARRPPGRPEPRPSSGPTGIAGGGLGSRQRRA